MDYEFVDQWTSRCCAKTNNKKVDIQIMVTHKALITILILIVIICNSALVNPIPSHRLCCHFPQLGSLLETLGVK